MSNDGNRTDAMIARLEREIEERDAFIQGVVANAQDAERDLTENEKELTTEARKRVEQCEEQLDYLYKTRTRSIEARQKVDSVAREMERLRHQADNGPLEYRSAGEYAMESYRAALGDRDAASRLDMFHRAAAHQKTSDNLGVIPDPVVGDVINFIDSARPLVSAFGPRVLPGESWKRPKVTGHTTVGVQGTAGAAADEKTELDSQKMTITRLPANAVTYGGYVNVSRQNIDFSSPQVLDLVINDLAQQYAVETEAATGALLAASANQIELTGSDEAALLSAIWTAVANVHNAVKGAGSLALAVSADQLGVYGRLFGNFINPQNAASPGFQAVNFGQGVMGSISGVPVLMSSGLPSGSAILFSTAAVEVYEQRVGSLQLTEPSVLGVQVAYAGYFTPLEIEAGGVQKIVDLV